MWYHLLIPFGKVPPFVYPLANNEILYSTRTAERFTQAAPV